MSELVDLRWDQVDFNQAVLHVRRVKSGIPSTHPLTGIEMRALRRLRRSAGGAEAKRRHRCDARVVFCRLSQGERIGVGQLRLFRPNSPVQAGTYLGGGVRP